MRERERERENENENVGSLSEKKGKDPYRGDRGFLGVASRQAFSALLSTFGHCPERILLRYSSPVALALPRQGSWMADLRLLEKDPHTPQNHKFRLVHSFS